MAAHSGILAWRIPWTEKPGGLWFMGLQRFGHSKKHQGNVGTEERTCVDSGRRWYLQTKRKGIRRSQTWDLPGGPVAKNSPSMQGSWVQSVVSELRPPHAVGQVNLCTASFDPLQSRAPAPTREARATTRNSHVLQLRHRKAIKPHTCWAF